MKYLQDLFQKVKDFVKNVVSKFKKPQAVLQNPVDTPPKPPVDSTPVVPSPAPNTGPVGTDHPNVIDALLGGTPHPVVDSTPVAPADFHEGFEFVGPGHPLRNTVPAGTYEFHFDLPEGKTDYQVDVGECYGTVDGTKVQLSVLNVNGGVETYADPQFTRMAQVFGKGEPGKKTVRVVLDGDNSFMTVVYF